MKFYVASILILACASVCTSAPISTDTQCPQTQGNLLVLDHFEYVNFSPVNGVSHLRRAHIRELYLASQELATSVHQLIISMSNRICEAVPPPHHHCFLLERDEESFQYNFTEHSMHIERLAADLCLLLNFTTPLHNAITYEQNNHSAEFAPNMQDIQCRFVAILEAIANITNIPLPADVIPTSVAPDDAEGGTEDSENSEVTNIEHSNSPTISGSHRESRDTRNINNNGFPTVSTSPPSPPAIPTDSSDFDLLNQQNGRQRRQADSSVVPHTDTDRCSFPQTDNDQLIYIYELHLAVWYTTSDLKGIRDAIALH